MPLRLLTAPEALCTLRCPALPASLSPALESLDLGCSSIPDFFHTPSNPTQQKRRSTSQGATKPLDPQRPEKTWVPAGASGHELLRPKRVSWRPAYGMMSAMSIPVSCVGVKTHVFMDDLVVAHWPSEVESTAPLDFLLRHGLWTPFGCLMSCKIRSIISVACDCATKSDGI